jgi:NitT/TauT family transport system substrate-binding protein
MKRNVIIGTVAVFVIVVLALGAWSILISPKSTVANPEQVTVGLPAVLLDASALAYIADDQHFFSDNGLNVTIKGYETGLNAVEVMIKENNNIAVATEFVFVSKALQRENITSFGTISKYQIHYLVGRKDHGIANVSDLRGKKIGFAYGTSGEFYLSRFLELNGLRPAEITPVDVRPSQYVSAIGNGTVDAILAWDPYVDTIKDQLGSNAVIWPGQSGQQGFWNAICMNDWATQHHDTISRFLKSIDQAVTYNIYHPAEAKAIVQKRSGADDAYIATTWANTQFSLSLDQSLITAMEDESRWMINNNLTATKMVPDFQDYLYPGGMEAVKPEAVNVIAVM